jgi:hypothetical protein
MSKYSQGEHSNTKPRAQSGQSFWSQTARPSNSAFGQSASPFTFLAIPDRSAQRRELENGITRRDEQLREMTASQRQGDRIPVNLLQQVNLSDQQRLDLFSFSDLKERHDIQQEKFKRLLVGAPPEKATAKTVEQPAAKGTLTETMTSRLGKHNMLGPDSDRGRQRPRTTKNSPASASLGRPLGIRDLHAVAPVAPNFPAVPAGSQQLPAKVTESTWQPTKKASRGGPQNMHPAPGTS